MATRIQVWDGAIPGERSGAEFVTLAQGKTNAREVIRSRVRQEVERYNQSLPEVFRGLVQPGESERILNGYLMKVARPLDWEAQFQRACSSFEQNGFLLVVDGVQVSDLDAEIELDAGSEVEFMKLVPLVGG